MESIASRYSIELYSPKGAKEFTFDGWESINYTHTVNDIGDYSIVFNNVKNLDRFKKFSVDSLVKVRRSVPGVGLDWYDEFDGLHRLPVHTIDSNGIRRYKSAGFNVNEILRRRVIAGLEGTTRSDKSDKVLTVMGQYINENIGEGATVANGRSFDADPPSGNFIDAPGVMAGFSWLTANTRENMPEWSGSKSFDNLFDVLYNISLEKYIDFQVYTSTPGEFVLKLYGGGIGKDRTYTDMKPNGRNGKGNVPVIFSVDNSNVSSISYSQDYSYEVNSVFVLGKGDRSTKSIYPIRDGARVGATPINLREVARSSSDQEFIYQLSDYGAKELEAGKPEIKFVITPFQTPSCVYGKHYRAGDFVTVKLDDYEGSLKIMSITVNVNDRGIETISNMELVEKPMFTAIEL